MALEEPKEAVLISDPDGRLPGQVPVNGAISQPRTFGRALLLVQNSKQKACSL